jgi:TPP-dependent pyruvate/acetoin dehydrogenase alpha subunit
MIERRNAGIAAGKISKWFGIGQEAISIRVTTATLYEDADEWIMPLHRNLGILQVTQHAAQ